ncbi:MAG TPA: transporter [Sulfurovum sp. UBA12169]|nr:MAG TPA: transporter [Sulfurovum sp. UBA12169]
MQLEKPKLFLDSKTFVGVMGLLMVLLAVRLAFLYQEYQAFINKPFFYTHADVLLSYTKSQNGKTYRVLKLRSDEGLTFYTTNYQKKDFQHARVHLQLLPDKRITFWGYLGTFFVKSRIKTIEHLPKTAKDTLLQKVASQHRGNPLDSFYNAIFFATPLDQALREKISMLGISHLVALSGFHLGIVWGIVYGLLLLPYSIAQQRYFPYRHALFDVGLVSIVCLGIYVWFVDFPPSLVRSYAMVLAGWIVLLTGVELLSFTFLTTIVSALAVLFPFLLVSLSFWLSVAGVFYIFLVLRYVKHATKWLVTLVVIPLGIFVLMLPVVHTVFGLTTPYQLLSPLLSLLFVPFYPLAMVLHLLQWGDMLDEPLAWLFNLPHGGEQMLLPLWGFGAYVLLSLGAVWSRPLFLATLSGATGYGVYLFI